MAVKTLKTGSTVEEKLDFLGEADMMKRFDHKNIVKLLGVCTRNEPIYTVMEFMLYGDLKTYLLARYANISNIDYLDPMHFLKSSFIQEGGSCRFQWYGFHSLNYKRYLLSLCDISLTHAHFCTRAIKS